MILSVDRIEGNFVICEDDKGKMHHIIRTNLPKKIREGDVLKKQSGNYYICNSLTQKRRESAAKLQKKLMDKS